MDKKLRINNNENYIISADKKGIPNGKLAEEKEELILAAFCNEEHRVLKGLNRTL